MPLRRKAVSIMENHLKDKHSRPLRDLRISVTDQCNFRCRYCMPAELFGPEYPFLKKGELLSFCEISRLAAVFAELGVKKIRLTGGEPLLRRNIEGLIQELAGIKGITDIGLTSNGYLLAKRADLLYKAGLRRVNISLDALNENVFMEMNGRAISPRPVLEGIEAALHAGLTVKINMVVQKGVNEDEIIPMAAYFRERGITLRFIEFMDVGTSNEWDWSKVVTKNEMIRRLSGKFDLEPVDQEYFGEVAQRYRYTDGTSELGFISSVTETFCSSCTRARLSADGKLYTCLFAESGFDLRSYLRSGESDAAIKNAIEAIWSRRGDRYSDERGKHTETNRSKIEMSYIGG